ncbi:MAG: ATP-binding protein, partial [Melioribacteraceae bacterium]|nr:ATP-binding protein [Melioribacteraceae bacterium]
GKILVVLENRNDDIYLDIADTGIGIPEEDLKKIFKQFYRASNLPGTDIEGSGLGLSLVKEIVERLNGTIKIESPSFIGDKDHPGTSVKIFLPAKQD